MRKKKIARHIQITKTVFCNLHTCSKETASFLGSVVFYVFVFMLYLYYCSHYDCSYFLDCVSTVDLQCFVSTSQVRKLPEFCLHVISFQQQSGDSRKKKSNVQSKKTTTHKKLIIKNKSESILNQNECITKHVLYL
jgi:hypothetical protein